MGCASAFAKALAHAAILGTAVPWSNWKVAIVAESAIKDGATLDQLTQVLNQCNANSWTVHDYVAPDPEHVPPIAESLPYVALEGSPFWDNYEDHAVTFATIVFVGTNGSGKQEVLFWEVLFSPITLQPYVPGDPNANPPTEDQPEDTYTLEGFRVTIAELAD